MFSLVGWQESKAGTTGYVALAAVPDQHVRVVTPDIFIPSMNQLLGVGVCGGTIGVAAYLDSPSLRRKALFDISPIIAAVSPSTYHRFLLKGDSPLSLDVDEGLRIYLKESTTTSEVRTAFALLGDGPLTPVSGEIFSVRATTTITSVTGSWVNGALTFSQTLPVGTYKIVGAVCNTVSGVCFRFVPVGAQHRPGGLCNLAVGTPGMTEQRNGRMGEWCEFNSLTPPTVELLAGTAASQSPELIIDLMAA